MEQVSAVVYSNRKREKNETLSYLGVFCVVSGILRPRHPVRRRGQESHELSLQRLGGGGGKGSFSLYKKQEGNQHVLVRRELSARL